MKTCNRCGTKNLDWDMPYHEKTKKWKLMEHRNSKGKPCGRVKQEVFVKRLTKHDVFLCELCKDSNFGLFKDKKTFEEHLVKSHPNGEELTELDYIHEFMSEQTIKEYYKNDKHYDRYVDF